MISRARCRSIAVIHAPNCESLNGRNGGLFMHHALFRHRLPSGRCETRQLYHISTRQMSRTLGDRLVRALRINAIVVL